jgi:hypothetical protein
MHKSSDMNKTMLFLAVSLMLNCCTHQKKVGGVYLYYWGEKDNCKIWIVDGGVVRSKIYKEYLYGGNEQRYIFNPSGEIWIDNAISCEEFDLTVAHELNERHLMAKFGWSYETSHDSSLQLEQVIRHRNMELAEAHEASLKKVSVLDSYNKKEIRGVPDSIKLEKIYRIPEGTRNGITIWVVDGYMIRKDIYPDFGFSGNDLAYHFIPEKEIWIDGQVSCEETEYSIALEMKERELMEGGLSYSDAYEEAVQMVQDLRGRMEKITVSHLKVTVPDSLERDAGIIDPAEKEFTWEPPM